jgi:PKD repeat protein
MLLSDIDMVSSLRQYTFLILCFIFIGWHAPASAQISPADLPGLEAWFAADYGITLTNDSVSQWDDQSSNARHATSWANSIRPALIPDALNGHPVLSLDGVYDFLAFPQIDQCRTIFWIMRENPNVDPTWLRPLLGYTGGVHFLRGQDRKFWSATSSHPGVQGGTTRVNGVEVDGTETIVPWGYFMACLQTSENVAATHITMEAEAYGRTWWGEIAEIIIYSSVLSVEEITQVEDYLANKYGPSYSALPDIVVPSGLCPTEICAAEGFNNYQWSTGESTPCINVNSPGDYVLTLTDPFGRIIHDTIQVSYPGNLILPDSVQLCLGESFNWSTGLEPTDGYNSLLNNEVIGSDFSVTEEGDYILNITDEATCVYSHAFHVEVDSLQEFVTLGTDLTLCAGNSISIQPLEWTDLHYNWSNGDTTSHIVINTTGDYSVIITDENNCTATDTVHVLVPGVAPQVFFDVTGFCEDAATNFTGDATDFIQSWHWTFGDGDEADGIALSHSYNTSGDFEVTLDVVALTGCTASHSEIIHVFPKPQPAYVTGQTCNNAPITFTDISSTVQNIITSWSWLIDGNFYADPVVNVTIPQTGFQNIILSVTDNNGCSAEISSFTEVFAAPQVDFTVTGTCEGTLTTFTENIDDSQSGNIISYLWNFDDDFGSSLPNPNHFFAEPGVYNVWLYAAASNGCNNSITKPVTIFHTPFADFEIGNACAGDPYVLHEESQSDPGDPVIAWHWIIDEEFTFDDETPSFVFSEQGLTPVSLQITTAHGCSDLIAQQLPVWNPPTAAFSYTPEIGEAPLEIQYINESSDLTAAYWYFGDTHESSEINPEYVFTLNGTYLTQLIAIGATGCRDTTAQIIHVAPPEYDLALTAVDWGSTDQSYQITARLVNAGNIRIREIMLSWQVGNDAPVTEVWTGIMEPGEIIDYQFHSLVHIEGQQYPYICIEAEPSPIMHTEINKTDNTICKPIGNTGLELFPPFPNPGDDRMFIRFITPTDGDVGVDVYDVRGAKVMQIAEQEVPKGFHQYFIDISDLPDGNYQLMLYMENNKAVTSFMKIHQ